MSQWEPKDDLRRQAEKILAMLKEKPGLYAALVEMMGREPVAGPWVKAKYGWIRYRPGGKEGVGTDGIIAEVVNEHPRVWASHIYQPEKVSGGKWRTSKEAMAEVDEELLRMGWLLP